jgi:RNA polymerase sigma-70 factor (ECF subfamily)
MTKTEQALGGLAPAVGSRPDLFDRMARGGMAISFEKELIAALPRLNRYAISLTREPDSAQDLVQNTALKALSSDYRPPARAILPWLIRIARNAFIDEARRTSRSAETVGTDSLVGAEDIARVLAIKQALAKINPDCRRLVVLIDVEGLTYGQAAHSLGIPIGTVMSRLSRARRLLLALLTEDEGGDAEPIR